MDKVFTGHGVDWKRQKKLAETWQAKGRYFSMERKKENNMPISYLFSCRFGYLYIHFPLKFVHSQVWIIPGRVGGLLYISLWFEALMPRSFLHISGNISAQRRISMISSTINRH
jgi:hypothetical protein